jgi:Interferon-induced transmembrane protein
VICPRCGTVAAGQATTCSRCGGRVDHAPASDHLAAPPVPRAPTERGELAQRAAGIVPQILARPKPAPVPVPEPVPPAAVEGPASAPPAPVGEARPAPGSGIPAWPPPPAQWEPGPAIPGSPAPAASPAAPMSVSTYSPAPTQDPPPPIQPPFPAPPTPPPFHGPTPQGPQAEGSPGGPTPAAPPAAPPGWAPPGPAWNQSGGTDFGGSTAGWAPTPTARRRFPGSATRAGTPSNYLWQSLVCMFLFLPSALVAVAYSAQVNRRVHVGDMTGAVRASRLARIWCLITVVVFAALLLWTMARGSVI